MNEVTTRQQLFQLFDDLLLDFIEEKGIQIWPDYDRTQDPWVITGWTAQCPKPFKQATRSNLKAALVALAFKMGELRFKESNA